MGIFDDMANNQINSVKHVTSIVLNCFLKKYFNHKIHITFKNWIILISIFNYFGVSVQNTFHYQQYRWRE